MRLEHRGRRHQRETDELAVAILRHEIGRHLEVVDEQHVVANAERRFHAIGDGTGGNRLRDQPRRDHGFLVGFLDQGFDEPVAIADPAGDEVVELVRRNALVGGAAADPQRQLATRVRR